ncbi:uncharacterized protein LOC132751666 [Ruditapes philippinarum]|uniref:uncharacterized protein LOC132751666 n=1 Tax=Ruditapes philippinarum TaxID=129788 RepID=UPI00295B7080|nr:uncharacterized protein LOC132751666 [Ruditapes philippinarum]
MPAQNPEQPGGFATDYYTMQSRRRNLGRNFNMNALQSNGMLRRTFNEMNSRRLANRAESEYSRSARSRQSANRRMLLPGSSYLDTPVSTPSPNIPDGFVYKPGNEPHLAAEKQFLEQQFYLTNELSGPVSQNKQTVQTDRIGEVTEQERIRDQMQMSRARQERLLRQQFFGLEGPIANNDLNSERYGVSGPFDGGVPSLPGEVKGLHNMHGSEAQSAIHNVEALH